MLRDRYPGGRIGRALQRVHPRIGDHTDYHTRTTSWEALGVANPELLSQRIFATELSACELLIDDDYRLSGHIIAFGQCPSSLQRNAHGLEVAPGDNCIAHQGQLAEVGNHLRIRTGDRL